MGKLHCFEETGEVRHARSNEQHVDCNGMTGWGATHCQYPILRRLSDEEAKAMQTAADDLVMARQELRAGLRIADERDKAMITLHAVMAERDHLNEQVDRLLAQLASRPALSEVEELAGRLLIADIGGPCQQSNCDLFNIAAEFIAFRTARREKHGETT